MTTCPACGANAFEGGVCARCGYAAGEMHRCPHCGAIARVEPRVEGTVTTWVCAVCGGPRIPRGAGGEQAAVALREAKALLGGATRAKARSVAWTILAVLATLVVIAASAKEAFAATLVLLVLAIVPALLAVRARMQGKGRKENADAALERAWLAAAEQVAARARGGVTADDLAKELSIDPGRADALLTKLAVHDKTRIDVGDDAMVRYSVAPDVLAEAAAAELDADQEEALADERRRQHRHER